MRQTFRKQLVIISDYVALRKTSEGVLGGRGEGDKPITRGQRYFLHSISLLIVPALLRDADDKENRHLAGASVI